MIVVVVVGVTFAEITADVYRVVARRSLTMFINIMRSSIGSLFFKQFSTLNSSSEIYQLYSLVFLISFQFVIITALSLWSVIVIALVVIDTYALKGFSNRCLPTQCNYYYQM